MVAAATHSFGIDHENVSCGALVRHCRLEWHDRLRAFVSPLSFLNDGYLLGDTPATQYALFI